MRWCASPPTVATESGWRITALSNSRGGSLSAPCVRTNNWMSFSLVPSARSTSLFFAAATNTGWMSYLPPRAWCSTPGRAQPRSDPWLRNTVIAWFRATTPPFFHEQATQRQPDCVSRLSRSYISSCKKYIRGKQCQVGSPEYGSSPAHLPTYVHMPPRRRHAVGQGGRTFGQIGQ